MRETAFPSSPWPRGGLARLGCLAWSLPYGLVGLTGAGLFALFGWGRPRLVAGAIEIVASGPVAALQRARGWQGFTLGWTIFLWDPARAIDVRLRRHERAHVRQALLLGPLMPVAYLVCLALFGYRRNPFEIAARMAESAPS